MHALDALGNPVRRAILEELRAGPLSVGEIAAGLPEISRPAVSRHLLLAFATAPWQVEGLADDVELAARCCAATSGEPLSAAGKRKRACGASSA